MRILSRHKIEHTKTIARYIGYEERITRSKLAPKTKKRIRGYVLRRLEGLRRICR